MRANVLGLIAILIAITGTAYASNEWTGDNIVDDSLTSVDYKDNNVKGVDLLNGTVRAADLGGDAIPSDDECFFPGICFSSTKIADRAVGESEISPGAVGTSEAASNSLTGSDINESALDSNVLQRRVDGSCAVGDSVRAVNATGTVTCNQGPAAFYAFDDDTGQICDVSCTELTLHNIPAGIYLIVAKIMLFEPGAHGKTFVGCQLVAGSDMANADTDDASYTDTESDFAKTTLPLEVIHTFGSTDNASINCGDFGEGDVQGSAAKIAAIRLGSVNQR